MSYNKKLINRNNLFSEIFFLISIKEWKKRPDASFTRVMRDTYKYITQENSQNFDSRKLFNATLENISISIAMQMACYVYEWVNRSGLDESSKNLKNEFKNLKTKIDVDGIEKTTNAKFLFKIIRDAFAHNDDNEVISNWSFDDCGLISINSKIGRGENRHNIKMNYEDLVKLIDMYFKNMTDIKINTSEIYVNGNSLWNIWQNNKLKAKDIKKYIKQYKLDTDQLIELDDHQINALLVFFEKYFNKELKEAPFNSDFLANIFPDIYDLVRVVEDLRYLSYSIGALSKNYYNYYSWISEIVKEHSSICKDFYSNQYLLHMLNTQKIDSLITANILFHLFSFCSIEKISSLFNEDVEKIKRIRNSLLHGNYYYNNQGEFEFYDGINKESLQHIATVSLSMCAEVAFKISLEDDNNLNISN